MSINKTSRTIIPSPHLSRVSERDEIESVISERRLLTLSLRLPVICNLNCKYCFASKEEKGLSYDKVLDIISQAKELGVHTISIVGDGEPLLFPRFINLLQEIANYDVHIIVFTNATLITSQIANKLFELKVSIVAKQNSLKREVQEFLSGPGSFDSIKRGIDQILKMGFNRTSPSRISLHSVIVKQNIEEIPHMWRLWRHQNIIPYIQVLVPPSESNKYYWDILKVTSKEIYELFNILQRMDNEEFGYDWDAEKCYPIAGTGCTIMTTGVGVTPNGDIQICSYANDSLGNIHQQRLKDIVQSDEVMKIRKFYFNDENRGCRALSVALTGQRSAKDPFSLKRKKVGIW